MRSQTFTTELRDDLEASPKAAASDLDDARPTRDASQKLPTSGESGDDEDPRRSSSPQSRSVDVAGFPVRRALPQRGRRTVGAWCFADHLGPMESSERRGLDVGPHPHMGLQTVTWLVEGEVLHRDSLGSEQLIRPGQLNLMTAGNGIAHAEESTGHYRGWLHGIQLWIAQPEATRHTTPAFEHFDEPPSFDLDGATATVLVGSIGSAQSGRVTTPS